MPKVSDVSESEPQVAYVASSASESENSELEVENSEDSEQSESEQIEPARAEREQSEEPETTSSDDDDDDGESNDTDDSDGADGYDSDDDDNTVGSQNTLKRRLPSPEDPPEDKALLIHQQRQEKRAKRNHWTDEEKERLFEKLKHGRASLVEIAKHVGPGKSLRHVAEYIEHMQFWSNRLEPVFPDDGDDSGDGHTSAEEMVDTRTRNNMLRITRRLIDGEEQVMVPRLMQMIQDIDSDGGDCGEIVNHPAVHMFHRDMVQNVARQYYVKASFVVSPILYTDLASELEKFLRRIITRLITKHTSNGTVVLAENELPQIVASKLDVRQAIRDEGFGEDLRMSAVQDHFTKLAHLTRKRTSVYDPSTTQGRARSAGYASKQPSSPIEYSYSDNDGSAALRDFIIDDDPVYKCAAPSSRFGDGDSDYDLSGEDDGSDEDASVDVRVSGTDTGESDGIHEEPTATGSSNDSD
ncbi:hypothetical protein EC988_001711 [Linderina pennispora]|nr:hypothetical protein EC988_001711 [Linderina pennispora]